MLYYSLDKDAHQPRVAYEGDAGMDLALKHDLTVPVGAHRIGNNIAEIPHLDSTARGTNGIGSTDASTA